MHGSWRKYVETVKVYADGMLNVKGQETCGSGWKDIGIYGSSWKLPPNGAVEASVNRSAWKLLLPPAVEVSICFQASLSFHQLSQKYIYFHEDEGNSKEANLLPWK